MKNNNVVATVTNNDIFAPNFNMDVFIKSIHKKEVNNLVTAALDDIAEIFLIKNDKLF